MAGASDTGRSAHAGRVVEAEEGAELEAGVGEGLKAEHRAQEFERYRYLEEDPDMARRGAPPPGRVMAGQRPGAEECCVTRDCGRRWAG